mmetsp:Transcript_20932/g.45461  ORF Transcript_20932/g.45461 Transcript_20932/m.45461 type:complete len:1050 (-) Transcript_20932:302-3451(-)|eukprot:CAMPEP_0168732496 /NCGR_PEP_ID=MMETSP0724-20121128/7801_1 /TAXON_ID=265536 /ORGANISM="Amphiprora sp., Strain CCMP467" /LENGTH=1049 /DNA_ID=CAMNT_0008779517 /DNA_START=27 /DNA_END=3176 /DNA_ORIENTATION=+
MARFWIASSQQEGGEGSSTLATSVDTSDNQTSSKAPSTSWFSGRSDEPNSSTAVPLTEVADTTQQSWFSWRKSAPTTPSNLPPIDANSSTLSQPWYSFSWGGSTATQPPESIDTTSRSWYSFSWGGSGQPPQLPESPTDNSDASWVSSSYDRASDNLGYVAAMVSSLYRYGGTDDAAYGGVGNRRMSGSDSSQSPPWGDNESLIMTLQKQNRRRERKRRRNPSNRLSPFDLSIFQNPYQTVRGLQPDQNNSHVAIRNFISLVPDVQVPIGTFEGTDEDSYQPQFASMAPVPEDGIGDIETAGLPLDYGTGATAHKETELAGDYGGPKTGAKIEDRGTIPHQTPPRLDESWSDRYRLEEASRDNSAETAAFLAEGTIRAWRDLCLEEALELNAELRYWSIRWERPLLSWLESGPEVWTSENGYSHFRVGKRVAQIQAVLARRCAGIGELQQHLLRAGWQKGVAQWGVLGHGGHWATVAGFDGSIKPEDDAIPYAPTLRSARSLEPEEDETEVGSSALGPTVQRSAQSSPLLRDMSDRRLFISQIMSPNEVPAAETLPEGDPVLPESESKVGARHSKDAEKGTDGAAVFVRKRCGGGTFVDDPAYLGGWSVDAISLVRQQLFRAANGTVELPYASNWEADGMEEETGNLIVPPQESKFTLPLWAIDGGKYWADTLSGGGGASIEGGEANTKDSSTKPQVMITDVPLMTEEVEELLYVMEQIMEIQRQRRLDRFRAPSWLRRNWYIIATSAPLAIWLIRNGRLRYLVNSMVRSVKFFFEERIQGPMLAIFEEIWTGRASFSDKKARTETMEVLRKMIKSFLDETYPSMAEEARQKMADAMDVSLVERKKEESMKTFFEISNVVRMSFIEMQWLKKEMMNALDAMDEVMSANDINMNIAAITPVAMIVYGLSRITKYFMYGLFRVGRSREETYAQFRATLMDIERLLVMRDNPPDARTMTCAATPAVLGSDDLGMLMLLIHECRTILWRDRRRFAPNLLRGVQEDLAELAGERGAVNVKQQLLIIARMARSYPFLKVISTGHFLGNNQLKLSE